MNKLSALAIAVSLAFLGGCSSMQPQNNAAAADDEIDYQKVATVDHWAQGRFMQVLWVNLPHKTPSMMAAEQPPPRPN
jgi:hypothetical protein